MSITYGSASGTEVLSFLVTQVLGSQAQQTGNNTIVLDNIPSLATGYGGDVGVGTLGVGDTYAGRKIMIGRGGTIQEREVISDTAGTGSTRILTVDEDWDTNPVATTDTVDVYYELADIEEGGGSGGISLATRTGLWTLTRIITIGNGTDPAGLAMKGGQALECADRGTADSFLVSNNGFFRSGYYSGGLPISGCIFAMTAASDDEPCMSFASGADAVFLDSLIWGQVATLSQISNSGANVVYDKTKILKGTEECELYADIIINSSITGESKTTEIIRVDANTVCDGLTIEAMQVLDSAANTTTETLELSNVVFSGVPGYVDVRQNKTWNLIDPSWPVVTYTDLTWTGTSTGNELNDKRSVIATVQESDGTKLQNALVIIHEETQLADLVVEAVSDVNGLVDDSFIYKKHATNSVTTTYGAHALRIDKWGYLPFVADQVSTDKVLGSFTLGADSNIVQTTQATALTDGSGITWNEDTNPSSIIEFTGGSGGTIGLAVNDTITGVGGATGIVTEIADGDGTAGKIHLKTRNATAYNVAGEVINNGADGWTANMTAASEQPFSIWLNANSKSYQTQHDYWAALTSETTLSATGELVHEWGRGQQARLIYRSGSSFFTERSNGKGVYIVDAGAGTLTYVTDDNGGTFTPSASVTIAVTVLDESTGLAIASTARVYIADTATKTQIMAQAVNGSGVASLAYDYTIDVPIVGWARELDLTGTDYIQKDFSGTITASGFSQTVALTPIT